MGSLKLHSYKGFLIYFLFFFSIWLAQAINLDIKIINDQNNYNASVINNKGAVSNQFIVKSSKSSCYIPKKYSHIVKPGNISNYQIYIQNLDQNQVTTLVGCEMDPSQYAYFDENQSCNTVIQGLQPFILNYTEFCPNNINDSNYYSLITINLSFLIASTVNKVRQSPFEYNQFAPNIGYRNLADQLHYNEQSTLESYMGTMALQQTQQNVQLQYYLVCDESKREIRFDWNLPILIISITIIIYILSRFSKIYSIKTVFYGFKVEYWYSLIYLGLYLMMGLVFYFGNGQTFATIFTVSLSFILCLPCSYFLFSELLVIISQTCKRNYIIFLNKVICRDIKLLNILSGILGLLLSVGWILSGLSWILNDLLSICIIATFLKIFKICSMKTATIFYAIILITNVVSAIIMHYSIPLSYDSIIVSNFSCPIEIQMPTIGPAILFKKCNWLPLTDLTFAGLFIDYNHRFDVNKDSYVYQILSTIGMLLGLLIWMTQTSWNQHAYPICVFVYPLMILFTMLWAYKRGDFTTVWLGIFYDKELLDVQFIKELEEEAEIENSKGHKSIDKGLLEGLTLNNYDQQL